MKLFPQVQIEFPAASVPSVKKRVRPLGWPEQKEEQSAMDVVSTSCATYGSSPNVPPDAAEKHPR